MKKWSILLLAALAGLVVLAGCQQPDLSVYALKTDLTTQIASVSGQTSTCMGCHNATTTSTAGVTTLNATGADILSAEGEYARSGHFNGYREVINNGNGTYSFESPQSNAQYANNSGCSKCHTAEGFINVALTGTAIDVPAASQIGCQTCHQPHSSGVMTAGVTGLLRTTAAITLGDGTTVFNKGAGNLCANCHVERTLNNKSSNFVATATTVASVTVGTAIAVDTTTQYASGTTTVVPTKVPSKLKDAAATPKLIQAWSRSPGHHGPNSDYLLGVGGNMDTSITVAPSASPHYTASTDGCVDCHMWTPPAGSSTSGTLAAGGHGMYLTDVVHGAEKDFVAACQQCHLTTGTNATNSAKAWPAKSATDLTLGTVFANSGHNASADYDGNGTTSDILTEVKGLEQKLVVYFSTGTNFFDVTYHTDSTGAITTYDIAAATNLGHGAVMPATATAGSAPNAALTGGRFLADFTWQNYIDPALGYATDASNNPVNPVSYAAVAFPYMTKNQAQALANFQYFEEDKSHGVHNPTFAAKLLYSACKLVGITVGATAP